MSEMTIPLILLDQVPALIGGTNFPIQRGPVIEHRMRIIDETLIT
jgi:hypothetical protein